MLTNKAKWKGSAQKQQLQYLKPDFREKNNKLDRTSGSACCNVRGFQTKICWLLQIHVALKQEGVIELKIHRNMTSALKT